MADLTTPRGRLDILVRETFPWSTEASTMACQTIRGLLADNDYFREMPSLAAYVKGQEDAAKLARIEARLETGKSYELAEDIRKILDGEAAPAAGTDEAPSPSTAKYVMPPESDGHEHLPIQNRDAKPPWCRECGLDAYFKTPVSRFERKS